MNKDESARLILEQIAAAKAAEPVRAKMRASAGKKEELALSDEEITLIMKAWEASDRAVRYFQENE